MANKGLVSMWEMDPEETAPQSEALPPETPAAPPPPEDLLPTPSKIVEDTVSGLDATGVLGKTALVFDHPEPGELKAYDVAGADSLQLNFDPADLKLVSSTQDGDLVLNFKNGGQIVLDNFADISDRADSVEVTLADGSVIMADNLAATLAVAVNTAPQTITADDVAGLNAEGVLGKTNLIFDRPEPGETKTVEIEEGGAYQLGFGITEPSGSSIENGNLVVTFPDGGQLIIPGYESIINSGNPPVITLADGSPVSGAELPSVLTLASNLGDVEPAAGDDTGTPSSDNGGNFSEQIDPPGELGLDATGPLGPTGLQFTAPGPREFDAVGEDTAALPEMDVEELRVKEDGSVQLVVDGRLADIDGSEFLTITIENIDPAWGVNVSSIGSQSGVDSVTFSGGTVTIVMKPGENFSGGPVLSPPADSDEDMPGVLVTVTSTEINGGDTQSVQGTVNVIVDAVIDTPVLNVSDATGEEDTPIPLTIATAAGDTDGSEDITDILISGVPNGASLSAGTEISPGVWQLDVSDLSGLELNPPADFSGDITLTVKITAEEVALNGDEFDLSDNMTMVEDQLVVTVNPVADPPTLTVDDALVKEDGSVQLQIDATLNDPATETLMVTIEGIDPTWDVDTSVSGGTYDSGTGIWMITLPQGENFSGGPILSPPADSDVDLTGLVVTAKATDGTDTSSVSETVDIIVDAVADVPIISVDDIAGNEDSAIPLDITAGVRDTDGSEEIVKVTIENVPDGASFSAGTEVSPGVWEFVPGDLTGLTFTPPANFSGTIPLKVTVFNEEANLGGDEVDFNDNTNMAMDTFDVVVKPVADDPVLDVNNLVVKEDGSVALQISAELQDTDGSETLTIEVSGIDAAWGVDTSVSGGTYDPASGVWSLTLPAGQSFSGGPTFSPPADSDVDLTGLLVTATVVDTDGVNTDTTNVTDTFDIIVDAVADVPFVDPGKPGQNNNIKGDEDTDIPVDITFGVTDIDGSEEIVRIIIEGVPSDSSFSAGANLGGGIWEFTPAEMVGLTFTPPENFSGGLPMKVTVFNEEVNLGGSEVDFSDNTNMAMAEFEFWVFNRPDEPGLEVENALVKEDGSVALNISATLVDTDGSETLTIEVSGIDPAWGVDTSVSGGTYDPATGVWSLTLPAGQSFSGGPTLSPPADSDVDLTGLVVTATTTDDDSHRVGTTSVSDTLDVIVDAVADTPTLSASSPGGDQDTPIALNIMTDVTDIDGSEDITGIVIGNVPPGATLSAGTVIGPGVWEVSPTDLAGLTITPPPGFVGTLSLTVTSTATETALNGSEVDLSDNEATATTHLYVVVEKDDMPIVSPMEELIVDESDLGPTEVVGFIDVDFGDDGQGSIVADGRFCFDGSAQNGMLTSNGIDVDVNLIGNTYVGKAGNNVIFTLVLEGDGNYTFTLNGPLDHADPDNPNDGVLLKFGVTVTDGDGDSVSPFIMVGVLDDVPVAHDDMNVFNLDAGQTVGNVITGEGDQSWEGEDSLSKDISNTITKVSFNGTAHTVAQDGSFTQIRGDHGTLFIDMFGEYTYESDVQSGESVFRSMSATRDNLANKPTSITQNGITMSIGDPALPGVNRGTHLTFVKTDYGHGAGIAGNGFDKIWVPGEVMEITYSQPADEAFVWIADIGPNNLGAGIDMRVYTTGSDEPVSLEFRMNVLTKTKSTRLDIDVDDIAPGEKIEKIEVFSIHDSNLPPASFVIPFAGGKFSEDPKPTLDVFEYTLSDGDGDSSTAKLYLAGDITGGPVLTTNAEHIVGFMGTDNIADVFGIEADTLAIIDNFDVGDGDVIDVGAVLTGFDPLTHMLSDFVAVHENNGNTEISINHSGPAQIFETVAVLDGVTGVSLDDIVTATTTNQVA